MSSIKTLIEANELVIAGGGGGVPVVETEEGLKGVPAVIDKDRQGPLQRIVGRQCWRGQADHFDRC